MGLLRKNSRAFANRVSFHNVFRRWNARSRLSLKLFDTHFVMRTGKICSGMEGWWKKGHKPRKYWHILVRLARPEYDKKNFHLHLAWCKKETWITSHFQWRESKIKAEDCAIETVNSRLRPCMYDEWPLYQNSCVFSCYVTDCCLRWKATCATHDTRDGADETRTTSWYSTRTVRMFISSLLHCTTMCTSYILFSDITVYMYIDVV